MADAHDPVPEAPDHARQSPYSFQAIKETAADFIADDALTQAAAVAFYTALSFAPLLVLATLAVGFFTGPEGEQRVAEEISTLMGPGVGTTVEDVMASTGESSAAGQRREQISRGGVGTLTGIVGIVVILYSATGVFAQLQAALNRIWDVEAAPGNGIWGFIRTRLLSVGVVLSILFLLMASLVVTAVLNAFVTGAAVWQVINFVIALGVYVVLFAVIFKYLPDVKVPWRAVWFGAVVTAVLFSVGRLLIGLYLAYGDIGSDYGGAGSVVALLVWVYYSAVILFVGAELTQTWAKYHGMLIKPSGHARPRQPSEKVTALDDDKNTPAQEAAKARDAEPDFKIL